MGKDTDGTETDLDLGGEPHPGTLPAITAMCTELQDKLSNGVLTASSCRADFADRPFYQRRRCTLFGLAEPQMQASAHTQNLHFYFRAKSRATAVSTLSFPKTDP